MKMKHHSARRSTSAKFPRTARVNEVLREVIALELEKHGDEDDRLALVTITAVETDPDLRRAKVFFSALASPASLDEVKAALEDRRIELQSLVGRNARMKNTPQLFFHADSAIIEGQRIEELISKLPPAAKQPDDEQRD